MEPRDDAPDQPQEETLATPGVIDKYQNGGKIVNAVLERVIAKCVPGADIVDVCAFGDKELESELAKVYNNKKIEKGIAFPTCISVNEICGHFSPLKGESAILKEGDVAKIDLGVHIDGFISLSAHTVVVTANATAPVEGRKADAILAAYNALQAALRLIKPGGKNNEVTQAIAKISESYKCNPLEGVLSHELKKHLIDGNNVIINRETFDQKAEEHEFQVNEVYALDVIVSTGEGKSKESEFRTTVFKRAIEKTYTLKTKNARTFFNEVIEKYPTLAFSLRSFEDEISAKIGVSESLKHDLLVPYPVLLEKQGEVVAQFKVTILVLKSGTKAITGLPLDVTKFKTDNKIEDAELKALIEAPIATKKNKPKKEGDAPAS